MGLDMYARRMQGEPSSDVDFEDNTFYNENGDFDSDVYADNEIHYWRKHPNLHGWMANLYHQKNGSEEVHEFIGPVRLTLDDLKSLEMAVMSNALPKTSGFFFGQSDGSEVEGDLEFIRKARLEIAEGWTVYYTSSW